MVAVGATYSSREHWKKRISSGSSTHALATYETVDPVLHTGELGA
jgi:hypothetical protein